MQACSDSLTSPQLNAHFEAGEAERALDLIRLEWGWMLTTNISVQSTLLEGYTSNGSLLYVSFVLPSISAD